MKLGKLVAAFVAASVIPLPAKAEALNENLNMGYGKDALATCSSNKISPDGYVCLAWINGAAQVAAFSISVEVVEAPSYCAPDMGTTGQYRDIFVKFLRENPAKRHLPAMFLFHQAMAEAFPC